MKGSVGRVGVGSRPSSSNPVSAGRAPREKGAGAGSHRGRGASPGMRGGAEKGATTKLGPQGLGVHPIKSSFHPFVSVMSQIYGCRSPRPTAHHNHHWVPDGGEKAGVNDSRRQRGLKPLGPG